MKSLIRTCVLFVAGMFTATTLIAQTTGDYRSQQTGPWNSVNSWARYDGGNWITPAPTTPVTADGAVNILSGHTITLTATDSIDQFTIDAGGKLIVNTGVTLNIENGTGVDATVNDSLINSGSITLDVSAELAFAGGGVYQHAQNGGTIPTSTWGSGSTCLISGVVGNAPANANQNFHHFTWNNPGQTGNVNLGWNDITIGGTIECLSSGTARFQMTNNTFSGTTITINGNVVIVGASLTSNGSSGAATYTINVMGDLQLSAGGNFGLSRGSGGNAMWRLFGNLLASNSTIQTSNSSSRLVFANSGPQTVTLSGMTYTGTINYTVDTNSTVTIVDGADAVDMLVVGTLTNIGTITPNGALSFGSAATYVHARNGGSVPTATWQSGSTCVITGVAGTNAANLNQNFHHFTWNCPSQTASFDWGWYNNTIGGNVSVLATGTGRARLTSPGASPLGPNTITITGSINVNNASFESNGSSSTDTITVHSFGNITTNGGNFSISRGSGPTVAWHHNADLSMTGSTTQNSGGTKASFHFVKNGVQKLSLTSVVFGGGGFPVIVGSNAVLQLDSSVISGSGRFETAVGAGLTTTHALGLNGNLTMNDTLAVISTQTDITYNGTIAQVTGTKVPLPVRKMTINNPAGVTLSETSSTDLALVLTSGTLTLGAFDMIADSVSGGSSSSYVNTNGAGRLTIPLVGSSEVAFPVGSGSYAPVWITNSGTVDNFNVSVAPDNAAAPGGGRVDMKWNVTENAPGGSSSQVRIGWMGSSETAAFAGNRAGHAKIFMLAVVDSPEAGSGAYEQQFATEPHWTSRGGILAFGSFVIGAFGGPVTSVNEASDLPTVFGLRQNYPNPFNPTTKISFDVPRESFVTLEVFDLLGRKVETLFEGTRHQGRFDASFNASGHSSGLYMYRLTTPDGAFTKRMVLIK